MTLLARALDFLFPPQCVSCNILVPVHGTLCLTCWQGIHFIADPMCECCGLPFEYAYEGQGLCGDCLRERPPFARARAAFCYDEHSKRLILSLKYHDQLHLAPTYGLWLCKAGSGLITGSDLIVPVPLHWRRFIGRRYNQSAVLAQAIGKHSGLPMLPDALRRIRPTAPQTGLSREQRKSNVRGAFEAHPKHRERLRGKTVLLIDDVMTTGATLDYCAHALLKGGAVTVNVLTLARTVG